jgi:Fic family protein
MTSKIWNWKLKGWPHFTYDKEDLQELEYQFSENKGNLIGVLKHINKGDKEDLLVDILSNEAIKTSEIEGAYLNRDSVQSSIKKNLGFNIDHRKVPPAEYGISEMMVDLYLNYDKPMRHQQLFNWHEMITNGRRDLLDVGRYRTHEEPMQVVSGRLDRPIVHFEAPPSNSIEKEMEQFIFWFNKVHNPKERLNISPLAKAGIAHLYFVCIHPFEDGNGRIGRAIAEKSLALSIQQPTLLSLSHTIESNKKQYYDSLETYNKTLDITGWLVYFSQAILDAQKNTLDLIDFTLEKTKMYDLFSSQLNERQTKVIKRLFDAGTSGFKGGLSADNYVKIAKTSASTATRDLKDLVDKKVLIKVGALKSTRYLLNIKSNKIF